MNRTAFIVAVASVSSCGFAQTSVSSAINLGTWCDANMHDAAPGSTDVYSSTQGGTLNTLSGAASSLSIWGSDSASAYSSATANWANPGKGTIVTDTNWKIGSRDSANGALNTWVTGQKVWRYTFTATSNSTLTFNWNVVGAGQTFGLHNWKFTFDGVGGGQELGSNVVYPDGKGTLVRSLTAGQTYEMGLINNGNIGVAPNARFEGSSHGEFDFNVQAVPEPFSMSALALGFVAVVRRRRK